jgi:hypothetical protein
VFSAVQKTIQAHHIFGEGSKKPAIIKDKVFINQVSLNVRVLPFRIKHFSYKIHVEE